MDTPQRWLVANWKMHGTRERASAFAFAVNQALQAAPTWLNVIFCPPAILLDAAQQALPQNARLQLGGQDCHPMGDGAYTGEISARMLAGAGARYVILGHSERRQHCAETCRDVRAKADAALAAGLTPILCIGETLAEYEAKQTAAVLKTQCSAFEGLAAGSYLVAYEPVWAIGSGKTPTLAEITAAHRVIKSALGSAVDVLYGGSVKPANLHEILGSEGVAGALIGGASLEADSMRAMVEHAGNGTI